MTVIRNNSISGINSITAQSSSLNFYDSTGNTLSIGADVTGGVTVATGATISGSTNTIIASTNGSERVRIDSSGNIGIGTDTIQANTNYNTLEIVGDSGTTGGGIVRLKTGNLAAKTMLFCDTGGFEARVETNHPFVISTNDTERLRITSAGEVQIANGNLVFSTSGTGIDFSANSNAAGMTSELLDDYEIGTWTPNQGDGLTVSGTFTSSGHYVKIGKLVMVQGRVGSSGGSISLSSTDATITSNLPFQPIDRAPGNGLVENHSTGIHLMASDTRILSGGTFGSTTNFRFAVTYRTS